MSSNAASGKTKSFTCHIATLRPMSAAQPAATATVAQNAVSSGIITARATPPMKSSMASAP